jgi:hypothetical protein
VKIGGLVTWELGIAEYGAPSDNCAAIGEAHGTGGAAGDPSCVYIASKLKSLYGVFS